jgi:hypothetical protein
LYPTPVSQSSVSHISARPFSFHAIKFGYLRRAARGSLVAY